MSGEILRRKLRFIYYACKRNTAKHLWVLYNIVPMAFFDKCLRGTIWADKQVKSMVADDTVFSVLYDKFLFWGILVGILTFAWMFYAMLRYRASIVPDTTEVDHIVVGSFPVERHNTKLEVMFYVLPTIIVVWLVVLALSSNTAVWVIPDEDDAFDIEVIGQQWFWEFEYRDQLTWQDDPRSSGIDITWGDNDSLTDDFLRVQHTSSANATNMTVTINGDSNTYGLDTIAGSTTLQTTFNKFVPASVVVEDADGNELHQWGHIPINHKLSTAAGDHLIVPCDDEVVLNLFSYTSDYSQLNSTYWGVQHSFWLPEWGVKEDLVPGLEGGTFMWFLPDDAGTFNIRCAEYCGLDHSKMIGYVDVVSWYDEKTREYQNCDSDSGVAKQGGEY